ncbi:MAG: adenylate/guanylate cyclase domain-containing protein [Pseudomonadota bacterium]
MIEETVRQIQALANDGRLFDAIDRARAVAADEDRAPALERLRIEEVTLLSRVSSFGEAQEAFDAYNLGASTDLQARALGARLKKDAGLAAGDDALLHESRNAYLAVADAPGDGADMRRRREHAGVNAVTLSRLIGDMAPVEDLAAALMRAPPGDSYWSWATRAELLAATGAVGDDVRAALAEAIRHDGGGLSDRAVTLRQLRLLGCPEDALSPLRPGAVLHYTGHMIAAPGATGRVLAASEPELTRRIHEALRRIDPAMVYGSFASGADIIIAEWARADGRAIRLFAPFALEPFLDSSVRPAGGDWEARARALIADGPPVTYGSKNAPIAGDDNVFATCARLAMGAAILRATRVDATTRQLLVWDGEPARGPAGAAADGAIWRATGRPQDIVDVSDLGAPPPVPAPRAPTPDREASAIVFGDVKAFSKLTEQLLPAFVDHVLGGIRASLDVATARYGPDALRFSNTWGDAIFAVFDSAAAAAVFAMDLQVRLAALHETAPELPKDLSIRLGMHFGVVHRRRDPVTGEMNRFGEAVARAARIEPITTEGRIFVTEDFAAELALDAEAPVKMEYVGRKDAAKDYGEFRLFRIRPKDDPA